MPSGSPRRSASAMRSAASVIPGNKCGSGARLSSASRKSAASAASFNRRARMAWMSGSLWNSGKPSRSGAGSTQTQVEMGPLLMVRCGDTSCTYVISLYLSIIRAGEILACSVDWCAPIGVLGETMGNGLRARAEFRRAWTLRAVLVTAVALALAPFLTPVTVSAQDWSAPRTVFVPSTGHTTDGLFLDVWRAEPDLLGDPVTEEVRRRTDFTAADDAGVVQYYENVALVYLPDEEPDNQVQLLDLGRQALEEAKAAGTSHALQRALERSVCAPAVAGTCGNVVASGHTVRGPFLERWQTGETARWLGPPLTESFIAPDGTRVQYFENGILRQTATGEVEPLPLGSIAAKRAKLDVEPIERPEDIPFYDEQLFIPPPEATPVDAVTPDWGSGPGPQQGAWKEVVVS